MSGAYDAIGAVGNTALVELTRVVPPGIGRVMVKVESSNPTGSMKDRMAVSVIDRAAADGRLPKGGTVVEYTGGSTGTSLAFVAAARGFGMTVVTSDAFSIEKRNHMRALGASVLEIPSDQGRITKELIEAMMTRAAELSRDPGCFYADQFNNRDAMLGYASLGEEIWTQTGGTVGAFVQAVGTSHCIRGVARVLSRHNPAVDIVAVEPAESPVLSGGRPGAHKIEGIGPGFVAPLWDPAIIREIIGIRTEDAKQMTRRLAQEEALFAGTSAGANVLAAIQVARQLGPSSTVVTLLCDHGLKYLSTDLYSTKTLDRP